MIGMLLRQSLARSGTLAAACVWRAELLRMELVILLSLAASICAATSSVCQRLGARHLERCGEMRGFDAWRGHSLGSRSAATNRELTRRSR